MAVTTMAEARDAINGMLTPVWNTASGSAPLFYDNKDGQAPAVTGTYGRIAIRWAGGTRAALGPNGTWRRAGFVFIQIFVPHGSKTTVADGIAEALTQALELPGAVQNIWFRDAGPQDIGSDGTYHQVNVVAEFQYDRIL